MNEVRRVLGDDARASQYIRTVHGYGYAFGGEVASPASSFVAAMLVCGKKSYPLYKGENLIGRAPDARVLLGDGTVSRRHAIIAIHDRDSALIRDLGSKNGTYVDWRRIDRKSVPVSKSTLIVFGAMIASIRFRKVSTTQSLRLNMPELKRQLAERMAM